MTHNELQFIRRIETKPKAGNSLRFGDMVRPTPVMPIRRDRCSIRMGRKYSGMERKLNRSCTKTVDVMAAMEKFGISIQIE